MRVFGLLLLVLLVGGCASKVGPDGIAVGAPCVDAFDCVTGSYCLAGRAFPDGTCTTNCRSDDDCRGDSRCVDVEGGVCLLPCASDPDCVREGYFCRERDPRAGTERVSVCTGG